MLNTRQIKKVGVSGVKLVDVIEYYYKVLILENMDIVDIKSMPL